jgi:hypothetical protein
MREHDLTKPSWGHNFEILEWNPSSCRGYCWLTPGPVAGDVLIVQGRKGPLRIRVTSSKWVTNVDDMYEFEGEPDTGSTEEEQR